MGRPGQRLASLDGRRRRPDRLSADRRERGRARVVPGRAFRAVHSLGRVQHPRRWRVGDEQPQDSGRRLREAAGVLQPDRVRCGAVGGNGQGRRHEIHHDHQQAPRWVRDVRLQGLGLGHRRSHAVQKGRSQSARRGVSQARPEALLLLFAARLAQPGLLPARPHRPGCGAPRPRQLRQAISTTWTRSSASC